MIHFGNLRNSFLSKNIKRVINKHLILTVIHDCDGNAFARVTQLPGFRHIKIQPGGPVRLACVYLISTDDSDMHDSWHPGEKVFQQRRSVRVCFDVCGAPSMTEYVSLYRVLCSPPPPAWWRYRVATKLY